LNSVLNPIFTPLQQATKIDDIEVLVESFIEAEDRNFSLFNYVNELTMEVQFNPISTPFQRHFNAISTPF